MADAKPVLNQLNIVARDFDAALAFYRLLGVDVPDGSASPAGIRHAQVTRANDVGIMSPLDDSRRSWPPVESPSR